MTPETWLPVPHWPNYEVSDHGRVRNVSRDRLMRPYLSEGYPQVSLSDKPRRWRVRVHTLVALAFIGPKPAPGLEIRHLDGDRLNNVPGNLAWGTHLENVRDMMRQGRHWQVVKTHCPSGHPYDEDNTRLYGGHRYCRACRRVRAHVEEGVLVA